LTRYSLDPKVISVQLPSYKKNFFKRIPFTQNVASYDWLLLGAVTLLCVIGLAFLASALPVKQFSEKDFDFTREFFKQLIFGVWIGMFAAFILARVDYHQLFKLKGVIIAITLASLLYIAVPVTFADIFNLGRQNTIDSLDFLQISPFSSKGAIRWIAIGKLTNFQPSEFAKLGLLIYISAYIQQFAHDGFSWDRFKKPFYAFALTALAIIVQPDLGSIVMIFIIISSALWVSRIPLKAVAVLTVAMMIFGLIFTFGVSYRKERVDTWANVNSCLSSNVTFDDRYRDSNFQTRSICNAIISGGLWGQGYGNSYLKNNIPEVTTDGIIAVISAEMGFVFTLLFLSLYLFIFLRGLKIAREAPDLGGKALATGIAVWILFQTFWNITGMTGLVPLKGLPLPFVSEGGTAMVINLAAIGILMNISSQKVESVTKLTPAKLSFNFKRFKLG
jgi:cell division protein FtsW